jgi:hypothetical protein
MLTTVSTHEVIVRPAEAGWAARRLARTGAYERRSLYELDARMRYADGHPGPSPLAEVLERETERLRNLLQGVQILEVMAPFPTDPRRVADALADCC